jgi:hypothetical protein
MKNQIIPTTIFYVPQLLELPLVESVADAILMYQLESLFAVFPDGFFKFLEPTDNPDYKKGNSWKEELFFSGDEFRTAFGHIGTAHLSKKAYDRAENKFKGKYYCSYYDRTSHKTYYFRNNQLADHVINLFFPE